MENDLDGLKKKKNKYIVQIRKIMNSFQNKTMQLTILVLALTVGCIQKSNLR